MEKVRRGVWPKARGWPETGNPGARCVFIYIYGLGYCPE